MLDFIQITKEEFKTSQTNYDLIVGEIESNHPNFFEVSYRDETNKLSIGVINNYPNSDLDPQVELKGNELVIGNNRTLTILNVNTKEIKVFPVFPWFYKFVICGNRIIVISEVEVFCLLDHEIAWRAESFSDMIEFVSCDNNRLIVSTYEDQKEIGIDIITGKQFHL